LAHEQHGLDGGVLFGIRDGLVDLVEIVELQQAVKWEPAWLIDSSSPNG